MVTQLSFTRLTLADLNTIRLAWVRGRGIPQSLYSMQTRFTFITKPNYLLASALVAGGEYKNSNLVDPASSHTLVSKIKPCMSKYKGYIQ